MDFGGSKLSAVYTLSFVANHYLFYTAHQNLDLCFPPPCRYEIEKKKVA